MFKFYCILICFMSEYTKYRGAKSYASKKQLTTTTCKFICISDKSINAWHIYKRVLTGNHSLKLLKKNSGENKPKNIKVIFPFEIQFEDVYARLPAPSPSL